MLKDASKRGNDKLMLVMSLSRLILRGIAHPRASLQELEDHISCEICVSKLWKPYM
jgi:hypothetical protein